MNPIIKPEHNLQSTFDMMDKAMKVSEFMAQSDIIPAHYRGKPANVFIAVQTAFRWNMDPMLIMQNTFVVNGKLGMAAQFAIALANTSGIFTGGIRYKVEGEGDNLQVTAYTTVKATNEEISYTVSMKMAKAENWTKNAKYQTLPELMLRYRAAAFLVRTHAPEVMNGMHMVEELEDVKAAQSTPTVTPTNNQTFNSKADKLASLIDNVAPTTLETPVVSEEPQTSLNITPRAELVEQLKKLVIDHEVSFEVIQSWFKKANASSYEDFSEEQLLKCINYIVSKNK